MFAMLRQVAANRAELRAVWPEYRRAFSRLATAHSSWFRIPDQGMEKHELLARGSGFFVGLWMHEASEEPGPVFATCETQI